ncbi:unnamed protein product [Caenorhabditis angaria]|uniref:Uncharacterized protein n=1 Tax=Caenorhabditis angaria TaxID=860376 RepID=A0A9P1NB26_9PELO|nr:unnamed protein product [Caenorhabditis angaria]
MTSNQEPHVIYQPAYVQGYPTGAPVNVWNQPPNQAVTYAIPYPPNQMGSYADKAGYDGYPPLAYQAHDNGEMMRQHHYQAQHYAQPNQWQYQQGQSHFIPTYATNFNAVTDPAYQGGPPPNMNRPPPNVKRDDFQGTIGMMENPAQSAAAYTASWVSSTSSIPPEMRDEPEIAEENGGNYEGRNSGQWPSLNEENRAKNDKSGAKKTERRDEPRELTFDERLEKARMQKDRVENQGFENNGTNNTAPSTAPPAQGAPQRNNSNNNNNNNGGNNNGANSGSSSAQNTGSLPAGAVQQTQGIRPESSSRGHNGPVIYNQGPPRGMARGGPQMNGGDRRNNYRQDYQNDGRQDMGYSGYQGRGGKRVIGNGVGNMPSGSGGMPLAHQPHIQHQQQPPLQQHQQQPYQMGLMHSGMPIQYAQPPVYAPQNHQYVLASPMTQTIDPQLLANIAALQNTHLSYSPMRRYLLPGPFGMMPQPIQQDAKFRNTWLDAQSYPPFGAMFGYDTRGRGGYRGRGGSRGGYRGGGPRRYDNRRDDRRDDRERTQAAAAPVAEEEGQEKSDENEEEGATSAETGAEIEIGVEGAETEEAEENPTTEAVSTETDEKAAETQEESSETVKEPVGEKDLASKPEQKEAKSEGKSKEK